MKKRKSRFKTLLPWFGLLTGLAVCAYFPLAEWYNARQREQVIENLHLHDAAKDSTTRDELLEQAHAWNEQLAGQTPGLVRAEIRPYEQQLSTEKANVPFATLSIEAIDLLMPIYHGTEESVLSAGVGHLKQTSLPVGGESTHAVLSAHSGMQSMKAFDDLKKLKKGDLIGISVLLENLCYEVTGTQTVLPEDVESIAIVPGEDLLTLVTCTPYGINTHRYLVHAKRVPAPEGFLQTSQPAPSVHPWSFWNSPRNLPLFSAVFLGSLLLFFRLCSRFFRRRQNRR